ncbi:hypothetical protein TCDM_09042 [Trypanosoma cruzi Dm28c]|uniref:Mucin-associated surface protein (MASP) n=1 Tax=Trypanosoma cruzi Dm28c TaxID=1416333 RepID=V5D6V0_TRYCR|nr:hypothetical protein TCDM_09042 [Trypanosoma cruzi Dm28c]
MDCDCLGLPQPARRSLWDGILFTFVLTVLLASTLYCKSIKQNKIIIRFVMNVGCASRGPTIRVVCGDHSFSLLLCFCVAVCAEPPLVCVRALREGCRHDGPLSPCVHAVEPCVPLLLASPSSICVLVLRQGCVGNLQLY